MVFVRRAIDVTTRLLEYVGRIIILALMFFVVLNVILRYVFRSINGAYDYVQMCMLVAVSVSFVRTAYLRAHIEISLLTDRLPRRIQGAIGIACDLLGAGLFAIGTWQCWAMGNALKASHDATLTVFIPLYPFAWVLAICMGVMVAVLLLSGLSRVSELVAKHEVVI